MGEMVKYQCKSCGYEKTLNLGCGLGSIRTDMIESTLSAIQKKQWNQIKNSDQFQFAMWEHTLGVCEKCQELCEAFQVKVTLTDGEVRLLNDECTECGGTIDLLEDLQVIQCPKCQSGQVERSVVGHWD